MANRLPIYEIEQDIVTALKATKRLILQAPTGSGKSTQVPQMLLKHGLLNNGQAVILQPRRLAARLLASRVAQELGVPLGREVGYQVRFESVVSEATRIKFETEGILLRQLLHDPSLRGIQAVIFDEFHERHLYGDITLARALEIYLWPCAVLTSSGRTFPVEVEYLARRFGANGPPPWELAADSFAQHVRSGRGGDVLVFMPGGFEIGQTIEAIRHTAEARG